MNAIDIQKTFLGKNADTVNGILRVVSEGVPEQLLREDHVLHVALKTIAQKKAHLKWCWMIIAEGKYEDVHQPVTIPNLKIDIVRRISKKQKQELYRSANVFVAHKGFGKTSIEAMAFGVPVIQMNNFRLESFVENGKNCLLVPVNDPKALALAMERVLVDTDLANHLRVGGTLAACTHLLLHDHKKVSVDVSTESSVSVTESIKRKTRQVPKNHLPSVVPASSAQVPYSIPSFDEGTFQKQL
jgi:glycosyltransferase involved in cell wall biosynthesis